jgi:hypothetical protein
MSSFMSPASPMVCRGNFIHAGGFLGTDGGPVLLLHGSIPLIQTHEGVVALATICWIEKYDIIHLTILSRLPFELLLWTKHARGRQLWVATGEK